METSAKTNINIEPAFCELAEAILDKTAGKEQSDKGVVNPNQNESSSSTSRCCA